MSNNLTKADFKVTPGNKVTESYMKNLVKFNNSTHRRESIQRTNEIKDSLSEIKDEINASNEKLAVSIAAAFKDALNPLIATLNGNNKEPSLNPEPTEEHVNKKTEEDIEMEDTEEPMSLNIPKDNVEKNGHETSKTNDVMGKPEMVLDNENDNEEMVKSFNKMVDFVIHLEKD